MREQLPTPTTSADTARAGSACLSSAPGGAELTITRIHDSAACAQRLREFGILPGTRISVIRSGDPVLIHVRGSKLAVDKSTAACIEVEDACAS